MRSHYKPAVIIGYAEIFVNIHNLDKMRSQNVIERFGKNRSKVRGDQLSMPYYILNSRLISEGEFPCRIGVCTENLPFSKWKVFFHGAQNEVVLQFSTRLCRGNT